MQPKSPIRAANKSFGVEVNQNSFPQVKQLNIHKLFVAAHANANAIACTFQAGRKAKQNTSKKGRANHCETCAMILEFDDAVVKRYFCRYAGICLHLVRSLFNAPS